MTSPTQGRRPDSLTTDPGGPERTFRWSCHRSRPLPQPDPPSVATVLPERGEGGRPGRPGRLPLLWTGRRGRCTGTPDPSSMEFHSVDGILRWADQVAVDR